MHVAIWLRGALAISLPATLLVSISPAQTFNTLVNFDGTNGDQPQYVTLVQGRDGSFYGTSFFAGYDRCPIPEFGRATCGLVFKTTAAGALTVVYRFSSPTGGENPAAGLVQAADGSFYGTTEGGGTLGKLNSQGTIFRMTSDGKLTTLATFDGTDGGCPIEPLVQGADGALYGTTGCTGNGTIFKITPAGVLTTLYGFCSQPNCLDGAGPDSPLLQGSDGNFYGTTAAGGSGCGNNGCGTIYRITPGGTLSTLHYFNGTDGSGPGGLLALTDDGNLYGVTLLGGTAGTVYSFNLSTGSLTTLHSFDFSVDGGNPLAGLTRGSDGNFYGTTYQGGENLQGTIFTITPDGTLTTLHSFGGFEGAHCYGGLLQGTDGVFYGVSYQGGTNGLGTIFSIATGLGPFLDFGL